MRVYNYHPETGLYLGNELADPSPLEPGEFLIPAHATTTPVPSELAGFDRFFMNGAWEYVERPKSPEPKPEPEPTDEELAEKARKQRQALLLECDYTQLADVQGKMTEAQKAEWSNYRQALRDITGQAGFPRVITWPTKPE